MRNKIALYLIFCCPLFILAAQDSLDVRIGQMILMGFDDLDDRDVRNELIAEIRDQRLGGIILYEKNLSETETHSSLARLISNYQAEAVIPLFMAIDEEGGKVNRLKPKYGFIQTVSAQYLGELNNLDSTRFYAEQIADQLYKFGFNINFAPVVDLNINPDNPVIGKGERSFSEDYQVVAKHASVFIQAHTERDIGTVLKHFPGHGSSQTDTHFNMADVSDFWLIDEIFPYKLLIDAGTVKGVMPAHIINRSTDNAMLPGPLSKKVVYDLLRTHLEFGGVVFSDDLQMNAISEYYGLEEAIKMGINAGLDVLLFCNNVNQDKRVTIDQIHSIIKGMVLSGDIPYSRIDESYRRIMDLKYSLRLLDPNYNLDLQKRLKELY